MLQPKQTKFRKMHKGRNRGLAQNGNTVAFGRFGLVASDRGLEHNHMIRTYLTRLSRS